MITEINLFAQDDVWEMKKGGKPVHKRKGPSWQL